MLPKLEESVLLVVLKAGGDATASDVQTALTEAFGSEQSFGSIFTTLDRLTAKKMVKWRKGSPDRQRGGRAPRHYTITGLGKTNLVDSLRGTETLMGAPLDAVAALLVGAL